MLVLRVCSEPPEGDTIQTRWFLHEEGEPMRGAGTLALKWQEWFVLCAVLAHGAGMAERYVRLEHLGWKPEKAKEVDR